MQTVWKIIFDGITATGKEETNLNKMATTFKKYNKTNTFSNSNITDCLIHRPTKVGRYTRAHQYNSLCVSWHLPLSAIFSAIIHITRRSIIHGKMTVCPYLHMATTTYVGIVRRSDCYSPAIEFLQPIRKRYFIQWFYKLSNKIELYVVLTV